ncbi:RNase H [Marivirga sericea]|uniref:RNase H n=1 Tax=Marivirga sericea TaxID=1028 RepID=A0A1X7IFM7_9BACT|nr:RNase H family protein [Marivirga sericea]SMG13523.1 RNase H [Marivirga sericea]
MKKKISASSPPTGGVRGLFIDGSVNNQLKVGYGAFLLVNKSEMDHTDLHQKIQIKQFENTSSTKLELQTLIWALGKLESIPEKLIVYTDSQNIISLKDRRKGMEEKNFYSAKGRLLNHHELYREVFLLTDQLNCEFVKVKGHQAGLTKNETEKIFTLVDRAARKASRSLN